MSRSARIILAASLAIAMTMAGTAFATGGGGGGGGSGGGSGGGAGGGPSGGGPGATHGTPSTAPAVNSQSNATDPRFAKAMQEVARADYPDALKILRVIVRKHPDNTDAWNYIGYADSMMGKTVEARIAYQQSIKIDPTQTVARAYLGTLYAHEGEVAKARGQLAQIEKLCGTGCAPYQDLAFALAGGALAATDESTDPDYVAAVQAIKAKNYADGLALLAKAVERDPANADAWNYTGFAERMTGRFDEALAAYRKALEIRPTHLGANEYLGELYVQTGHLDLARQQLAKLKKLCTTACEQYQDLAWAIRTGKLDED